MKTTLKQNAETAVRYETENDIPKAVRGELVEILNQRLADIIDLQTQLKQAHWNVKGPHFIGLHELFDKIAEGVESYVDMIADGAAHVEAVARALSTFGREARLTVQETDRLDDADSADIFTEVSRGIDK